MWYPISAYAHPDPMRLVREAKDRGEEVRLVTGFDPGTDCVVVAWHIPSTNQMVIEGTVHIGE